MGLHASSHGHHWKLAVAEGCSLATATRAAAAAARRLSYRHKSIAKYKGLGLASAVGGGRGPQWRPWATVAAVGHGIATYIGLGLAGPGGGSGGAEGGAGLGLEDLDHTI